MARVCPRGNLPDVPDGVVKRPGLGSVIGVVQLTDDLFDAIEFDAARGGDHLTAALRMSRLAKTGEETGGMSRAEAHLRAGEQWLLADDPGEAADAFRLAITHGGPAFADPKVALARALFLLGERQEALTIVGQLEAAGPRDPRVCDLVAELLLEQSDLHGALTWLTAGVKLCLPDRPDLAATADPGAGPAAVPAISGADRSELRLLLNLRYRIRNDLGLPEDGYDQLIDVLAGSADPGGRADG